MSNYIPRLISTPILDAQKHFPVTLITGARRVGKSTLCHHLFPDYAFVNLEDVTTRVSAMKDPAKFLANYPQGLIIDEVQNAPILFSQIQANVDTDKSLRYILTGSSDFKLMREASQSMAGRVATFTLPPFSFKELGADRIKIPTDELILRGAYPSVWCDDMPISMFYRTYYNVYVERDVRGFLNVKHLLNFDRFIRLMAGRAGSEFKAASLAVETGVSANTISEWVSMLAASYIIFPLQPFHANLGKRLTKMPKFYFHDTGLLCYLLGIETPQQLSIHPLRGAIFENMAVSELYKVRINQAKENNLFFYRENSGKEVDLIRETTEGMDLYEIKSAMTLRHEFYKNMDYLAKLLPNVKSKHIIYDGKTLGDEVLNIRNI